MGNPRGHESLSVSKIYLSLHKYERSTALHLTLYSYSDTIRVHIIDSDSDSKIKSSTQSFSNMLAGTVSIPE